MYFKDVRLVIPNEETEKRSSSANPIKPFSLQRGPYLGHFRVENALDKALLLGYTLEVAILRDTSPLCLCGQNNIIEHDLNKLVIASRLG